MSGEGINPSENYKGVWGHRIGFGEKPAVLGIDFMMAYTTPGAPLFAEGVVRAVCQAKTLYAAARAAGVPLLHTNILYRGNGCSDGGVWVRKAPVLKGLVPGSSLIEFCEGVEPAAGEMVVTKQYASAFFGTSLASTLHAAEIDTVILAGCSTSGCVRASAVDAVQSGFRTIVVRECVGDRHQVPHEANLFDIDAKYGDVVSLNEILAYLSSRHPTTAQASTIAD